MLETKTHQIDGVTYDITQLEGMLGIEVLGRLVKVFGSAFAADDPLGSFTRNLSTDDIKYLCTVFAKTTLHSTEANPDARVQLKDSIGFHFAGKYGRMLKWLWACIDVNYETFFADLGFTKEVRDQLMTRAKSEMLKPATSPAGSSGASSSPASVA
jgi:hypothetical protein